MKLYPQKPPMTETELASFLNSAPIARLGTLNPDGTIHLAALWFKYIDGGIVIGTQDKTSKIRNIKRNPNVTVLIDNEQSPFRGVLIYGQAQLDYENVLAKRIAIFEKYMPPENAREAIKGLASAFTPIVIRVKPQRISSYDYAKEGMIEAGSANAQ
jgi:PPOX class probable F420-dependent enzyme